MHLLGSFIWMLKWLFFQPFIRLKILFAQCQILSLPDSKNVIKLSSILQSNTEDYSTSWAVTTVMSLCLGHKNGRPLIWHTLYKQSKNYLIYVQKYFFLNSYCTPFSFPSFTFPVIHVITCLVLYYFCIFLSVDEKHSLLLKLVIEHAIGKHRTWFSDCVAILTQISNWSVSWATPSNLALNVCSTRNEPERTGRAFGLVQKNK